MPAFNVPALKISHKLIGGFAALASVLLVLLTSPALAVVELGLTPSHVFATWKNINTTLVTLGKAATGDERLSKRMESMEPRVFTGKKPGDVLEQLAIFRGKLDQLRSRHGLQATPVYKDPAGGEVTPSVVFLNSGNVLDSTVLLLIRLDESRLVSGYFTRHDISGKTPDGPYSLIDLANRQMDALMK